MLCNVVSCDVFWSLFLCTQNTVMEVHHSGTIHSEIAKDLGAENAAFFILYCNSSCVCNVAVCSSIQQL